MTEEGPGPSESGPSSASEVEALRRRLYGPDGLPLEDLQRYERLVAEPAVPEVRAGADGAISERPVPASTDAQPLDLIAPPHRRRRRRAAVVAAGLVACVVIAVLLSHLGPHPLPRTVALPGASGTTLLFHSRVSDPASSHSATTWTTADYTLLDPEGRHIGVVLRCIGAGRVRVFAGTRFDFRCSDREIVQRQRTPDAVSSRFRAYALTTGNVVWSVRIVRE